MATTRKNLAPSSDLDAVRIDYATGAAAIALSMAAIKITKVECVTLHLDAAPTTSEDLTITLNSVNGAEYDTNLYTLDLSVGSTVDLVWYPDFPLYLIAGDAIDVAYANTDTGTYGVEIRSVELE